MDIRYMRRFIADQYSSSNWKEKVNHMPEKQVIAIYYSMINRKNKQPKPKKEEPYHQMSLGEYTPSKKKEPIEIVFNNGYTNEGSQIQFTQLNLFDFMKENV